MKDDWIKYGIGMVYMQKGSYKKAEKQFRGLLKTNPSYGNAYAQMGFIRKFEGRIDEANLLFGKALSYLPENEMGNYQCGVIYVENRKYDRAEDQFSKVLENNPSHLDAFLNLSVVCGRKGDFDKAAELVGNAYQIDKKQKDGFAKLGWIKAEGRDWSGALALMEKDLDSDRLSPHWQVHLAQVYGHMGNFAKAIEMIEQVYRLNKSIKDGFVKLGWIKTETKEWDKACGLMEKDHKLERLTPMSKILFSMIQVLNGDSRSAERMIEGLYANNESIVDGYAKLGWANYLSSGNKQMLRSLVDKDEGLKRLSVEGRKIKAITMSILGKPIQAQKLMDSLYSENSSLRDGYAAMGWRIVECGNLKAGLALMEKDYRLRGLSSEWQINYAYQLAKAGQYRKARTIFNELMEIEPLRQDFRIGYQLLPLVTLTKIQFQKMIGF